ncbi:MAG: glycosyltransferase [Pseudonocardiaceae bacterium]
MTGSRLRVGLVVPRFTPFKGAAGISIKQAGSIRTDAAFRPVRMREVELSEPLPCVSALDDPDEANGRRYGSAWVLVRLQTEPIGVVEFPLNDETVTPAQLAEMIWRALRPAIVERATAGSVPLEALPPEGLQLDTASPYLLERASVLAAAPSVSVVVCTRDRVSQLAGCLAALECQHYPDYEVVVVDNAPSTDAVTHLLATRPPTVPVRRVVEPRPGLAWARNCGLRAAAGQVVAYLDDDEVPDLYWLAEIARGFRAAENVGGVSGMILPVALDTQAQSWFEQFGGHSKGRGFTPVVFDSASHAGQHPLYPLPPFGAGGNLAFDRGVLAELGGFDVALGTGTPARGAEDTAAICDLMLAGHTLAYQPSAFVRHRHYEDWPGIANQLHGYGTGLTAFYTRTVLRDPRRLLTLLRLAPTAARDLFGRDSVRTVRMSTDYPVELTRLQRRGMLAGPRAYLRSRRLQRRLTTLQQTTS